MSPSEIYQFRKWRLYFEIFLHMHLGKGSKKINSMGGTRHGWYPPSVQLIIFLKQKMRPLKTVLNGLKHEKNR